MVFVLHFSLLLYKIYRNMVFVLHFRGGPPDIHIVPVTIYIYMVIITFTIFKLIVLIVIIWDILCYYWSLTDWLDVNLGVQKMVNVDVGVFYGHQNFTISYWRKKMERKICQKFKQPFFTPYQFVFSILYLKLKD